MHLRFPDRLDWFKQENKDGVRHRICGLVTEVPHRTNQKGEGFGLFKLQDYHGSVDIRLFKEQYLLYKALLETGTPLFMEGTYEKNTWRQNDDEWVFKVSQINYDAFIGIRLCDKKNKPLCKIGTY